MTFGQAYQKGKNILKKAGVESPAFDAVCLFRAAFGMDRQAMIVHAGEESPQSGEELFFAQIAQRAQRRPLQYILGEWEFLSLKLKVGEGVLIAREETELLVRVAAELLKDRPGPRVLDLCAGTGAVGLGLAGLLPGARVTCVELYEAAFSYLRQNIGASGFQNVRAVRADILDEAAALRFSGFDAVVSNPPYVKTGEIPTLQAEVRREPAAALDGGEDGLDFYGGLAAFWLPRLNDGGVAAVEIGEGQESAVSALFEAAGLSQIEVYRDFNGINRVVSGILRKRR